MIGQVVLDLWEGWDKSKNWTKYWGEGGEEGGREGGNGARKGEGGGVGTERRLIVPSSANPLYLMLDQIYFTI